MRARLDAPALRELLEIVLLRAQQTAQRLIGLDLKMDDMAEEHRLHESVELEDYFAARRRAYRERYRAEGIVQGIEQGIERGIAQGVSAERDLLRRQADRKFDARTAARLAVVLADIRDAEDLARAGEPAVPEVGTVADW